MKKKTKNILIAAGIIALVFFAMKAFHKKPVVPMPPRPVETALAVSGTGFQPCVSPGDHAS